MTPVPKTRNSEEVNNFCPISVLSVVAKVLERIVHRQLYAYLQRHSILHGAQSGFRPQHTTQDVLVSTIDDWRQALDKNKLVGSIMLDLSKAFDTVCHPILYKKLERYGVKDGELKWFKDYLTGRKQKVSINVVQSDLKDIRRGVPQGSILGPLLFTIYVNDLPSAVSQSEVKQYADDTTLYCACDNSMDLSKRLNTDLIGVANWVKTNGLILNEKKTQMLLLSWKKRAKELENVVVKLNEKVVARCDKVKYLGVWIDEGLTWRVHVEAVRRKCFGGLAQLKRNRDILPEITKKNIYNALVLPSLDYCCVVWHECRKFLQQRVERIQNYAMRLICAKPPRTLSEVLRGKLNWMTLTKRREIFRQVLIQRSIQNQAPSYLSKLFQTTETYGPRVTQNSHKLHLTSVNTEFCKNATSFRGSQIWNSLPQRLREMKSINSFRTHQKAQFLQDLA